MIRRFMIAALMLLSIPPAELIAKKQGHAWKQGILLEERREDHDDCRKAFFGRQRLLIEGDEYRFTVCRETLGKPNLTIHGPIKYSLERGGFYVLDENGRVFKFEMLQKELKEGKR